MAAGRGRVVAKVVGKGKAAGLIHTHDTPPHVSLMDLKNRSEPPQKRGPSDSRPEAGQSNRPQVNGERRNSGPRPSTERRQSEG